MRALVLSGGGAHGAWQAGALLAIEEAGLKYDAIVGTSVGSINGAGLSAVDAKYVVDMWLSIKKTSDVMVISTWKVWKMQGLNSFGPLDKFLKNSLSGKQYKTPVYVCRLRLEDITYQYDLLTGEIDLDVVKILGSSAVAGVNEPIDGHLDGGHGEQIPTAFAKDYLNADSIDIVMTSMRPGPKPGWKPWRLFPIASNSLRALEAMIDEGVRNDTVITSNKMRLFQPKEEHKTTSYKYVPDVIKKMIEDGYNVTRQSLVGK